MIILTGYVHLKPEDVNEFVEDIRKITASTRAEKGCLFYNIVVEDATAGRIVAIERWQDQASLNEHLGTPRMAAFFEKWMNRLKSDVMKYDAANERSLMD